MVEVSQKKADAPSFLRRNLDHIVCMALIGIPTAVTVSPNLFEYTTEGHQRALEAAIYQGGYAGSVVAMYYVFNHYYKH